MRMMKRISQGHTLNSTATHSMLKLHMSIRSSDLTSMLNRLIIASSRWDYTLRISVMIELN